VKSQVSGFSLIEVMIAVAILATVLTAMAGNIFTLHKSHTATKELAKAQEIAQALAERVQGATWHSLGQTSEPWSWHRREGAAMPMPQPMTDRAVDPNNDLQGMGIIGEPSGIADSKVYLEYYLMSAFVDPTSAAWMVGTRAAWQARRADPAFALTQDPAAMYLTEVTDAVIVRVVVTWTSTIGGTQRHEIMFARRK
jgi:prepilin-type N-terminal cleavage/methylation domain-containing protein